MDKLNIFFFISSHFLVWHQLRDVMPSLKMGCSGLQGRWVAQGWLWTPVKFSDGQEKFSKNMRQFLPPVNFWFLKINTLIYFKIKIWEKDKKSIWEDFGQKWLKSDTK